MRWPTARASSRSPIPCSCRTASACRRTAATVYVAETESGRLWAFDLQGPGDAPRHSDLAPHGGRLIAGLPGHQRLDSLAVDDAGNIHVATLSTGCITVVSPGGEVVEQIMTGDPMTTNVCFGGPDRRTAYVTLSGRGQLVAMDSEYQRPRARLGAIVASGIRRAYACERSWK